MRTWIGWAVTAVGALCVLAGVALAVVLGPDSRFTTGPHAVETDGIAVVTAPGVVRWQGVQVDVLAEVPVNKPVFVGLGNSVDVQDYVRRTRRLEVTKYQRPWDLTMREVKGSAGLPGAPTALDWWIEDAAGLGGASISATLPDETVSLAVLAVGATNLSGLEVSFAYGIRGGFARGLGLALAGGGLLWGGVLLRRGEDPFVEVEDDPDDGELVEVEEEVYVWVDEHGVEHEISEEEALRLQAEEDAEASPDGAAPEPDLHAADRPAPVLGVVTAGDIVAGVDPEGWTPPPPAEQPAPSSDAEPEPEADPDPEPEPEAEAEAETETETEAGAGPAPEPVVYVWIDDDGVEHEVSADELDEFEVVDDDEEDGS